MVKTLFEKESCSPRIYSDTAVVYDLYQQLVGWLIVEM